MIGGSADSTQQMAFDKYYSLFQQPEAPVSSPSSIYTNFRKGNMCFAEEYVPGPHDVICQRGKDCNEHGRSFYLIHNVIDCLLFDDCSDIYSFFLSVSHQTTVGNRRFRDVVDEFVASYLDAKTRQEKSIVISTIIDVINSNAGQGQGGFIMKVSCARKAV
jgi:hypothetical protein